MVLITEDTENREEGYKEMRFTASLTKATLKLNSLAQFVTQGFPGGRFEHAGSGFFAPANR